MVSTLTVDTRKIFPAAKLLLGDLAIGVGSHHALTKSSLRAFSSVRIKDAPAPVRWGWNKKIRGDFFIARAPTAPCQTEKNPWRFFYSPMRGLIGSGPTNESPRIRYVCKGRKKMDWQNPFDS